MARGTNRKGRAVATIFPGIFICCLLGKKFFFTVIENGAGYNGAK
jgi:hypothetical protein